MKSLASLVLIFCMTMPLLAQQVDPPALPVAEAKIVLSAPSKARVGELVRLDVSESTAESFQWILIPDSVDFQVYDSGRRAVFSARIEGDYRFVVACALGGTVDVVTHVVRVTGPLARPTSESLTEWIPYWMQGMDLPSDKVEALARSFEKVAADMANLPQPKDWITATAEANRDILGSDLDMWKPLLEKIGKACATRQLTTPERHAETWLEIAAGLRKG